MKKTFLALAVLGAFAGSAMAADVTLYGKIDAGLNYHHQKVDGEEAIDQLQMKTGQNSSSRFGLKGTEDLGNGLKVGFVLENGFNSDTGELTQSGKIFGRESNVYLQGGFGTLSMGRVGALSSGLGSYSFLYNYTVYGTGCGDYAGSKSQFMLGDRDRMNNTVTYVTPDFSGLKIYAQYSFAYDGQEVEHTAKNNRYYGLGANYNLGAFSTGLVIDSVNNANTADNTEDSLGISWGASYDFGVTKVMGLFQYGKNENMLGGYGADYLEDKGKTVFGNEGMKGYAIALGAITPLFGGSLYTAVNYTDGETDGAYSYASGEESKDATDSLEADIKRWGVTAGYQYPLSKRTYLYGFAAYNEGKADYKNTVIGQTTSTSDSEKIKDTEVGFGMVHNF